MKASLHILLLMLISIISDAQSTISIQINHLLDEVQFENEVNSTNDLGNDFMIDRLQYYLSGFSIVHDGGQVTAIDDLYVLVDLLQKAEPSYIPLGDFEIEELEAVRFHFGVDEVANHADPSLWPAFHPLAPQFPSMHWGWASGYRFIALEGKSGPNLGQDFEFHCIGDTFYSQLEFPVAISSASSYIVTLDAEYSNLLSEIDVTAGVIIHGDTGEMRVLVPNIVEKVFTIAGVTSSTDQELAAGFEVYPNPVQTGLAYLQAEAITAAHHIQIYDTMGRLLRTKPYTDYMSVELQQQGIYHISINDESGAILATQKVVVQ